MSSAITLRKDDEEEDWTEMEMGHTIKRENRIFAKVRWEKGKESNLPNTIRKRPEENEAFIKNSQIYKKSIETEWNKSSIINMCRGEQSWGKVHGYFLINDLRAMA